MDVRERSPFSHTLLLRLHEWVVRIPADRQGFRGRRLRAAHVALHGPGRGRREAGRDGVHPGVSALESRLRQARQQGTRAGSRIVGPGGDDDAVVSTAGVGGRRCDRGRDVLVARGGHGRGTTGHWPAGCRGTCGRRSAECERGFVAKASRRSPRSRRTSQALLAASRLPPRTHPCRSGHPGTGANRLRRQRPHVRPRAARLRSDARRLRSHPAGRAHFGPRRSEQRRRLRTPPRVCRQTGISAIRDAARRQQRADDGVPHGRGVEVHRRRR